MDLTLVIMAAGIGSRFGSLKQLAPVDDDGNFLLDYSIYDAIKAGFNKVVFVINESLLDEFKKTVGKRIEGHIKVEYAFQKLEDIPYKDLQILKERTKPWGTTQAIYCTKNYVSNNFAIINSDDFYGYEAYEQIVKFFKEHHQPYEYVSIPYQYEDTASNYGTVKRGLCKVVDDKIAKIVECSIERKKDSIIAYPLDGSASFNISSKALVSMNMFGFSYDIYELLEKHLKEFFSQSSEIILKSEVLLPDCLEKNLEEGKIKIYSRVANCKWIGMTYKEDLKIVKEKIKKLKEEGHYPQHLWD